MKRFLSLTLLTLLTVGITHNALAITNCSTIIYEAAPGEQTDYIGEQYDLIQYAISADIPLDNFKLGFDCTYSLLKNDSRKEYKCYAYKLKGGLALANTDQVRLDLIGGYFYGQFRPDDIPGNDKITYDSMIVGLDAKLALSERVWMNASYAYGINPQVSTDGSKDRELDQLFFANVRLNFQFLEDTGLSVGYRWETIKDAVSASNCDIQNTGYTIGLSYIF
jgi:hypothetical protein